MRTSAKAQGRAVNDQRLQRVERLTLILVGVATLLSLLTLDRRVVLGVGLGGMIATGNFFALRRLLLGVVRSDSPRKQGVLGLLLVLKFGVLALLLFLVLRFVPLSGLALLCGISVVVLAIAIEGLRGALQGGAPISE